MDAASLEKVVGFKDRKEEISDIKFSPGTTDLPLTRLVLAGPAKKVNNKSKSEREIKRGKKVRIP